MSPTDVHRLTFPLSALCNQVSGGDGEPTLEFLTIPGDDGKPVLPLFTFQAAMTLFAAMRRIEPTIVEIPHDRALLFFLRKAKSQGFELAVFDPATTRSWQGKIDDLVQVVRDRLDAGQ